MTGDNDNNDDILKIFFMIIKVIMVIKLIMIIIE